MAGNKRNTEQGCTLTSEQFNRLMIVMEQIGDLAELLLPHLGYEKGNPSMTAYNVILEKSQEASGILLASCKR
jgi:hypothetical protein